MQNDNMKNSFPVLTIFAPFFFKKRGTHFDFLQSIDQGLSNELSIIKIGAKLVEISFTIFYNSEKHFNSSF